MSALVDIIDSPRNEEDTNLAREAREVMENLGHTPGSPKWFIFVNWTECTYCCRYCSAVLIHRTDKEVMMMAIPAELERTHHLLTCDEVIIRDVIK